MPGVPSYRGCEACRKQKKKCDQLVPACSRCARLGIECVGSGTQRYKFLDQTSALAQSHGGPSTSDGSGAPSMPPSNTLTTLTSSLVSAMTVTDARFDLTVYGHFFEGVPCRLGMNPALDASVRALTVAFPSLRTRQHSAEVFRSYSDALKCLRDCLNNPSFAQSPETLCAVYLVMICQGWIGRHGDFLPSHAAAIAHLLSSAAENDWRGAFETGMVATLAMIVVMESFANQKIKLDPRILAFPKPFGPRTTVQDANNIESLRLHNLARTVELIRDIKENLPQIRSSYELAQSDCAKLKTVLSEVPWQPSADGHPTTGLVSVPEIRLHVRQQTCYGVLLFMSIMLNSILKANEPSNRSLELEASMYVDEVIDLSQQAEQYRPLGSSATPLYLIAAWSVVDDPDTQATLERLISNYQADFASTNWLELAVSLKPRLRSGLELQDLNGLGII